VRSTPIDLVRCEGNACSEIRNEECSLETTGKGADIDSSGKLEFSVMASPEQWCVQEITLHVAEPVRGPGKVSLGVVVQARDCSNVPNCKHGRCEDDEAAHHCDPCPQKASDEEPTFDVIWIRAFGPGRYAVDGESNEREPHKLGGCHYGRQWES
jgi:hypothetical protein